MKICEGEKKALTLRDLDAGDVFTSSHVDGLLMLTSQGQVVALTDDCDLGSGAYYHPISEWDVTAVYPNACINPGEPE